MRMASEYTAPRTPVLWLKSEKEWQLQPNDKSYEQTQNTLFDPLSQISNLSADQLPTKIL